MQFNLADLFESVVDAVPEREALVCGQRRLSYAGLEERANRLAHYLRRRGIGPGDHVGLYLYNGTEFVEAILAVFKIRAVPININYRYVEEELCYLFDNADLSAVIYQRAFGPRIRALAEQGGRVHGEGSHRLPEWLNDPLGGHGGRPGVPPPAGEALTQGPGIEALPQSGAASGGSSGTGISAMAGRRLLIHVDDSSGADCHGLGSQPYEQALAAGSPRRDFPERSAEDLYIIYTGGTTGLPKGVMWRHEDIFFAGLQGGNPGGEPISRPEQLVEIVRANSLPMCFLPVAPFIHGAAQWAALIGLFAGGKIVLSPKHSLDARLLWKLVEREHVNTMTIVGDAMARPLAEALEEPGAGYDTSSLVVIGSAGAIFSESVKDRLRARLPSTMLIDSFGSTESGHTGSMMATRSASTSGHPRFLMSDNVTVLDDELRPLRPGSGVIGRLARRGHLPVGYYKDPEKTAATFVEIDGERWVMPGDLATVDEEGTITVFGRGSVCINSGGEKIFPEEVEEVLKDHPEVLDVVVVGVPDERWGERVAAVVQPAGGARPALEDLCRFCRQRLAGYKVPRELHLVDELGRQPSGKPDYRWARNVAAGGRAAGGGGATDGGGATGGSMGKGRRPGISGRRKTT